MEVRLARPTDIATYAELGRVAQAWLRARGLGQYVPAAHDEYAAAIRARVAAGTLYAVEERARPLPSSASTRPRPRGGRRMTSRHCTWLGWSLPKRPAGERSAGSSSGGAPVRPAGGGIGGCVWIATRVTRGYAGTTRVTGSLSEAGSSSTPAMTGACISSACSTFAAGQDA